MTDKKTAYLSLPLPNADNALAEDCPRLAEALTTLDGHAQSADARLDGVEASVTTLQQNIHAIDASAVHTTGDETVSGVKTFTQTIAGTAAAAEKLATARTITLSGAASGSISFDGSADATLEVSIGGDQGAVIGEVRWFAMSTPPTGWLVCNGASVGTSDYAALFAAIGNTFLPEDASVSTTTFNLPDLMGKVPWGSTSVGTALDAGLPNIKGSANNALQTFSWSSSISAGSGAITTTPVGDTMAGTHGNGYGGVWIDFDASKSNSTYGNSTTVQPPALCLLPCIRYE